MSGELVHSPAKITLEVLIAEGLGFRVSDASPVDWMVFVNKDEDRKIMSTGDFQVSNIINVFDTTGIVDSRVHNDGEFKESHGVQIVVRLNDQDDYVGYKKAKDIQYYLDTQINRYPITVPDTLSTDYIVHSYNRTSDVIRMYSGGDENTLKGLQYSLNLLMFVTKT